MSLELTSEEKETAFEGFIQMIKRPKEFPDEYFLANWWMGKYVTSAEFDKILGHKELPAEFRKELMDHHTDWIEEMSEEAFQQYLDKQNNHTLFPVT
jgi:hypothetical protein